MALTKQESEQLAQDVKRLQELLGELVEIIHHGPRHRRDKGEAR